jgi:hypothetical protein
LQGVVKKSRAGRTEGVAGGGGIRGVGLDQNGGAAATQNIAVEVLRNVDDELNIAAGEKFAALGLRVYLAVEIEVTGVLDGVQQAALHRTVIGDEKGGGQVLGVGVDGKTKKYELQNGNADHHGEGEAVAAHLDEFLDHHGPEAPPGKFVAFFHGGKLAGASLIR